MRMHRRKVLYKEGGRGITKPGGYHHSTAGKRKRQAWKKEKNGQRRTRRGRYQYISSFSPSAYLNHSLMGGKH